MRVMNHKFKAKAVNEDGAHYASKLEHRYKNHLELLKKAGEIVFYLRQVPFFLPGGTKLIVDYQIFWSNGTVDFIDVKGMELDTFKIKKREVEAIYPIEIKVIKKGDF